MNNKNILYLQSLRKSLRKIRRKVPFFDNDKFINYVYTKYLGYKNQLTEIHIVALRGSAADYSFYSPDWPNSFNFGLTSSDLHHSLELYRKLLCDAPRLRAILFFGGVFSPGFDLVMTSERHRLVTYKHFFQTEYDSDHIKKKNERKIVKKILGTHPKPVESNQGFVFDKVYQPCLDVVSRASKHLRENKREPDQMEYFYELKRLVERDGRQFFFVIPPFRSDYLAALGAEGKDGLFDKFESVLLPEQVLDYSLCDSFCDSDFGDCYHLNELGARKLTALLMARVLENG